MSKGKDLTISDSLNFAIQNAEKLDVDKLERVLAMQKEIMKESRKSAFFDAISSFQEECPTIIKNKKGHNSNYASFDQMAEIIKPYLAKNGLNFRFRSRYEDDQLIMITIISHREGYSEESETRFKDRELSGGKNDFHAAGSALSYARRYGLQNALGLSVSGEDDDAKRQAGKSITTETMKKIEDLISATKTNPQDVLKYLKAGSLQETTELKGRSVLKMLNGKLGNAA